MNRINKLYPILPRVGKREVGSILKFLNTLFGTEISVAVIKEIDNKKMIDLYTESKVLRSYVEEIPNQIKDKTIFRRSYKEFDLLLRCEKKSESIPENKLQSIAASVKSMIEKAKTYEKLLNRLNVYVIVLNKKNEIIWKNKKSKKDNISVSDLEKYHGQNSEKIKVSYSFKESKDLSLSDVDLMRYLLSDSKGIKRIELDEYHFLEVLYEDKEKELIKKQVHTKDLHLQIFSDLTKRLVNSENNFKIAKTVTDIMVKRVGCIYAGLALFESENNRINNFVYNTQAITKENVTKIILPLVEDWNLFSSKMEMLLQNKNLNVVKIRNVYEKFGIDNSIVKSDYKDKFGQKEDVIITRIKTRTKYHGYMMAVKKNLSKEDKKFINIISERTANHIDNVYYYDILRNKLKDMERIQRITQNLTIGHLQSLMKQILDIAIEKTSASSGSIMLLNPDSNILETIYASGENQNQDYKKIKFKVGEGAAGKVAETGEILAIKNKTKDSRYKPGIKTHRNNAYVGMPLLFRNRVHGVLNINFKNEVDISPEIIDFLKILSSDASIAIRNSRLYTHYVMRVKRLSALYDIAKTISASLNIDEVLELIVSKLVKLIKADVCTLFLLSGNSTLQLRNLHPHDIKYPSSRTLDFDKSISGETLKSKEILYREDVTKEPNFISKKFARRYKLKSLISIPLLIDKMPFGVINLYTKKTRKYFSGEIDLLKGIADLAAIAIEKATLYNKVMRDKEVLQTISEITNVINSTIHIDELIKRILKKTIEMTHSERGVIFLKEDEKLVPTEIQGYHGTSKNVKFDIEETTIEKSFNSGQKKIIPVIKKEKSPIIQKNKKINSSATYPIELRGEIIGILHLESKEENNYSKYDKIMEIIMQKIAVSFDNANLHKQTIDFNKRLKTEIEKATKDLREANKRLLKLDIMKDEFVSNVSHELRTPLTSIKGYSKLIASRRIGELTKDQSESMEIIISESERLSRLINDLLDISKFESGIRKPKLSMQSITEVIHASVESLKPLADEKSIDLVFLKKKIDQIYFDSDMIMRVLDNLISNAIKFTPRNGKVSIKLDEDEKFVSVAIRDTGIGIPKERIKNIFDKFYQVNPSLTKSTPGTGLGLTISKNIISLHKGDIEVTSEENKGSVFTFTISRNLEPDNDEE